MGIELHQELDGKILNVRASGKLAKEDYGHFMPEFEKQIQQHGKIRLLFQMDDFHGWSATALWEDIKLDFKHFSDIERHRHGGRQGVAEGDELFLQAFHHGRDPVLRTRRNRPGTGVGERRNRDRSQADIARRITCTQAPIGSRPESAPRHSPG